MPHQQIRASIGEIDREEIVPAPDPEATILRYATSFPESYPLYGGCPSGRSIIPMPASKMAEPLRKADARTPAFSVTALTVLGRNRSRTAHALDGIRLLAGEANRDLALTHGRLGTVLVFDSVPDVGLLIARIELDLELQPLACP